MKFLNEIHRDCRGVVELRSFSADGGMTGRLFSRDPKEVANFVEQKKQTSNVYFSCSTRFEDSKEGKKLNCDQLGVLWLDIDYKDFESEEEADLAIARVEIEPSCIVTSGGGLHVYWFLDTPLSVQDEGVAIEELLKDLAHQSGADFKATDVSRILRVPGTTNFPNRKKRESGRVESFCSVLSETGKRYSFEEIRNAVPSRQARQSKVCVAETAGSYSSAKAAFESLMKRSQTSRTDFSRSANDMWLANRLVSYGLSDRDLIEALLMANPVGKGIDGSHRYREHTINKILETRTKRLSRSLELPPPSPIHLEAFQGPIGRFVQDIILDTEADPGAILTQLLVGFGNLFGRRRVYKFGGSSHYCNLFLCVVGETSKGRKGTGLDLVRMVFPGIDSEWEQTRIISGIGSGEGIAAQFRPNEQGSVDRRLLITETEFVSVLHRMYREGSTISPVLRNAWDTGNLSSITKSDPILERDCHISLIAHITRAELLERLKKTELLNGFGNRFLFVTSERTQCLPFGGENLDERASTLSKVLKSNIEVSSKYPQAIRMSEVARELWSDWYSNELRAQGGPMVARGEPIIVRLAMIYAVADASEKIEEAHLRAAKSVWDHGYQAAEWLFNRPSKEASRILSCLLEEGRVNRSRLIELFNKKKLSYQIDLIVEELKSRDLIIEYADGRALYVQIKDHLRSENLQAEKEQG